MRGQRALLGAWACALLLLLLPARSWGDSPESLVADASSQAIQNTRADDDDLSRMRDVRMVRRFVRAGYLVPVPASTRSYYLHGVPRAYRYARPWTKLFLDRLSRQFYARFKRRLRVTSLVRTAGRQRRLARSNANAADAVGPLRSSHLTGASLDFSKRFMSARERRWVREVLYSLREQGWLYAIEEFELPVFHVMVYRAYPDYVKSFSARPRTRRTRRPPGPSTRLTAVRTTNRPGSVRITLHLDGPVSYTSGRLSDPRRVYFDLADTVLAAKTTAPNLDRDGPVGALRVAQFDPNTTRIAIEVGENSKCTAVRLSRPDRLVIDVKSRQAHRARSDQEKAARVDAGHLQLIRTLGLQVRRVVIDAGHGGHDTGTIGRHGAREKDITLGVALRLGRLLKRKLGLQVVYTRTDDTFVSLQGRTAIANRAHADLFVSIHANSSRDASVRGVETYYLDFAATPEAMAVAERENRSSEESTTELQKAVRQIAFTEKSNESRLLAASVDRALHSDLAKQTRRIEDRGVKKAPFVVLMGANMPSILVEISFLSNPVDERHLDSGAYRQKIARALLRGISAYIDGLGDGRVASK